MTTIKRYKLNKYKLVRLLLFCLFFVMFIISAKRIIIWFNDNYKNKNQIDIVRSKVKIEEINGGDTIGDDIDKEDPYWDFIKMKLINVNFKDLIKQNSDTVGWIQVNGTNINYPFVQTSDNDFYLNHSFNKSKNSGGWLFMDYRNSKNDFDRNTIIYGHNMKNKTMFGSLKNILTSSWIKDTDNYIVKLSTEYENTLWQVFSIYNIPTTNDYLDISFNSEDDFLKFGNMLLSRSEYNFNTSINKGDKILTLSTCFSSDKKTVLHAKLIKRLKR